MDTFFARNRLSAYLDGSLGETEAAEVAEAIERDPELRSEFEAMKRTVDLLRRQGPAQAPAGFHARVMARVQEEPAPNGVVVRLRQWWSRVPMEAVALAAAAAIVVIVIQGRPDAPADALPEPEPAQSPAAASPSPAGSPEPLATGEGTGADATIEPVSKELYQEPPVDETAGEQQRKSEYPPPVTGGAVPEGSVYKPTWEQEPQAGTLVEDAAQVGTATTHGYQVDVRDADALYALAELAKQVGGKDAYGRALQPRMLTAEDDYVTLTLVVPRAQVDVVHAKIQAMGGRRSAPVAATPPFGPDVGVFVIEVEYRH